MSRRRRLRWALTALCMVALLPLGGVAGCGMPDAEPTSGGASSPASSAAGPDTDPSLDAPREAGVAGVYVETSDPALRLLLCDDGRSRAWYEESAVWSDYRVDEASGSVTVGEVGALAWDPATGVLAGADIGDFVRLEGDVGRVAQGAAGKSIEELEKELDEMEDELDREAMRQLGGESDPQPQPTAAASITPEDVAGTYGKSGEEYTVTLRADGTYESGVGLAYDCGTFTIDGLTIRFHEDPTEDMSVGNPVCGTEVTYDSGSRTLRDQWDGVWQLTEPEEPDPWRAF